MGEFSYAEHPEGCSLRGCYKFIPNPVGNGGSARSAVGVVGLPSQFSYMGEIIYAEHPEGCSLRLFYQNFSFEVS